MSEQVSIHGAFFSMHPSFARRLARLLSTVFSRSYHYLPTAGADRALPPVDPAFKRTAMYLFLGTRGGGNRIKIVKLLKNEPLNANRIRERLDLDYKTIMHHIKTLEEHRMIVPSSDEDAYGKMYFLSPYMERHMALLEEIWAGFGQRKK